jgi:hypothetical protein
VRTPAMPLPTITSFIFFIADSLGFRKNTVLRLNDCFCYHDGEQ